MLSNAPSLRKLLVQQLELSRRMLELAERQQQALIEDDLPLLLEVNEMQQKALEEHKQLERSRQTVARNMAKAAGLERTASLMQILPSLPSSEQMPLYELREELLRVHTDLEAAYGRNRMLLKNGLAYIKFSLNVLTTAALQPARYGCNLSSIAAPTFYLDSKA